MIRKLLCNFPALIIAAVLARHVGHSGAAAIFTGGKRGFAQSVMAPALVPAAPCLVLLGDSHEIFSENFTLLVRQSFSDGGSEVEG